MLDSDPRLGNNGGRSDEPDHNGNRNQNRFIHNFILPIMIFDDENFSSFSFIFKKDAFRI
jgi:hypothetical protein